MTPEAATSRIIPPGGRPRRRAIRWAAGAALTLVALAGAAPAQAAPSSGILPGSRITVSSGVDASAQHGDTLYLGGPVSDIGLRASGLAATDATTGKLDTAVPELESDAPTTLQTLSRVASDGRGGAYAFGVGPKSTLNGAPARANWLHFGAGGQVDRVLTQRFTKGDGLIANVNDVAVAADGTSYVAGDFTAVDGQPRQGLAALTADGTLTAWAPSVSGGAVQRLYRAGDGVLLVGSFTAVLGQARSGLGLVAAGDDGGLRPWAPTVGSGGGVALTAVDAASGIAVDGDTAYLAGSGGIYAVPLTGTGIARDLGVRPSSAIDAIAAGAAGRLYVGGRFRTAKTRRR